MFWPLVIFVLIIAILLISFGADMAMKGGKGGAAICLLAGVIAFLTCGEAIYTRGTDSAVGKSAKTDYLKENWTYLAISPVSDDSLTWVLKRPDGELQMFRLEQKLCRGELYTARERGVFPFNPELIQITGTRCS